MRSSSLWHWALLLLLVLLEACTATSDVSDPPPLMQRSGFLPPSTLQDGDILGTWQSVFTQHQTSTLQLTADWRYTYRYTEGQGGRHYEGEGTWHLERRASGCIYLHIDGMPYFYGAGVLAEYGNRFTPDGEPFPLWERCEDQHIPMPDKLILTVSERPTWPSRIGLSFPTDGDMTDEELKHIADSSNQPIPMPTRALP